jgi:MGT family glycosyltransferase
VSRFLFAVPPLAGHVNPTVAVGRELTARGHQVAWCGPGATVAGLLPDGATLLPAGEGLTAAALEGMHARWLGLRGFAALKSLWEDVLIPIADAMVPGVEEAAERFRPDVVVADQQALAGAAVARRRHLPWATSATTFSELSRPYASVPAVAEWVGELIRSFGLRAGLSPAEVARVDLRFSGELLLVFTAPELAGSVEVACSPVFVGPAIGPRPSQPGFPWRWLDGGPDRRRRILASLGTHSGEAGSRFYRVLLEAVAPMADHLQVILAAPAAALDPGDIPDHVLVAGRVPQLALLRQVDAVVSHGGLGTVSEALLAGRPLVLAPIRDDQPLVAERVEALGAGIRVRFGRVQAGELAAAIGAVLTGARYRQAAVTAGRSLAAAGGAPAATDQLEKLAAASTEERQG